MQCNSDHCALESAKKGAKTICCTNVIVKNGVDFCMDLEDDLECFDDSMCTTGVCFNVTSSQNGVCKPKVSSYLGSYKLLVSFVFI